MGLAYNELLRRVHGVYGLRAIDYPARTLGVGPWRRDAPLPQQVIHRPAQAFDPAAVLAAQAASSSYEGLSGRGSMAPSVKDATGSPWYGPGVV